MNGDPLDELDEAWDEVKRLRLTDDERAAIACAVDAYALNDDDNDCRRIATTLRGLLERLQ